MRGLLRASILLGGLMFALQSDGAMVLNGNFESPSLPLNTCRAYTPSSTPAGFEWTVSGSIDHLRDGLWYGPSGIDDQFIDLDGQQAGAISQSLTLGAGAHTVYFMLAGNPSDAGWKGMRVSFGSAASDFYFNTVGQTLADLGWVLASAQFSLYSETTSSLVFQSLDRANSMWGPLLDDIYIDQMPSYAFPVEMYAAPDTIPTLPDSPNFVDPTGGGGGGSTPVPEPSTFIAGALLLLPFAFQTIRHFRSRKQPA